MRSRVVATVVGAVTSALAVSVLAASWIVGLADEVFELFFFQTAGFALVLGLVAIAAARRGELNLGVWVTTLAGSLMAFESLGILVGAALLRDQPELLAALQTYELTPSDLPLAASSVLIVERAWLLSLGGFLTIGLLLFPDGRLPSRSWRPVAGIAVVGLAVFTVANVIEGLPGSTIPFEQADSPTTTGALKSIAMPIIGIAAMASVASLFFRYRRVDEAQRHQIRWMLYGAGVFAVTFVVVFALFGESDGGQALNFTTALTMPLVIAAYGMAILRYRLYDIDIVIRRSVVFGALAIFITGVYVAIVVGLGSLIGDTSNILLAVGATALVAVLFEPVRVRVQHWANVWVYGQRATPYEVLAGMSATDRTPDEQLSEGARLLAEATGAQRVVIWSGVGSSRYVCAVWPPEATVDDAGWDLEVDVQSEDGSIGSVALTKRPGEPPTAQDRRLVTEFAGQASLLLANMQLNERLRLRLDELGESRKRLVSAQDETRRKLERDLHDGAQQQLVALKVKLGMARTIAAKEGADQVAEMIAQISGEAEGAVDTLRDLARGIYPPLLEAEGLKTAVEAQARRAPIPVTVHAAEIGRYSREVETAIYFCVLEALTNVTKYAGATSAHVRLGHSDDRLTFSVEDDGLGFDPEQQTTGTGLQGMFDRLDTLGGELEVVSSPGSGTVVRGALALEPSETELSSA